MPHELPKAYDPRAIEARWAEYWVREQLFAAPTPPEGTAAPKAGTAPVFTLLLPPPNVTGRLHMGHMLNQTEMDIVIRWHRMRGYLALWLPGTDHAGIATQMMVERQLASEGKNRRELGREKFVERVWEWRKHYGGAILEQMKRLGASVDWGREYFTMDEGLSRAVREVFVRLYEEGLIYRGNYIVNWCPRCQTAISDLEVVHEETPGKLYQIRYAVVGSSQSHPVAASNRVSANVSEGDRMGHPAGERVGHPRMGHPEYVVVATTRPETMLGDTAVAVNEKDERYRHLHGKKVLLPLMEREIPIIVDELAKPEFGTGAVKVTPAHDPNDFEAGLRHGLPQIIVMDETGRMNENAGRYVGLDRFEAREKVLQDLEAQGLLAGTKDYVVPLGKCDRCKTIVEPRLSTQWFLAVDKEPTSGGLSMAEAARRVVQEGGIRFTPENFKTIYLQWMDNIHDWCISRQLWWGHRIPAWYCGKCAEITVARETPAKCGHCGSAELRQDTDVLDTWFSSALLPFTTLGWPEATRDLEVFYPTSLLITGTDILFFWVARMIMMGCHFMMPPHRPSNGSRHRAHGARQKHSAISSQHSAAAGAKTNTVLGLASQEPVTLAEAAPFREVYIHALVRDAERQKMSKTKGNVMDPIEVIEQYGTDATRFTLAAMASPGTDIAFNPSRTEGYRAFANKIWNAARFMFMNVDKAQQAGAWKLSEFSRLNLPPGTTAPAGVSLFIPVTLEDRWILSRFNRVTQQVQEALAAYRFHESANVIYDFFWGEFCDWYVELVKPRLMAEDKNAVARACMNVVALFEAALRLLHPIMPFITEEIWQAVYDGKPPVKSIALARYPAANAEQMDTAAETEMAILQDLIVSVRNIRAELKIEPKQAVRTQVHAEAGVRKLIEENRGAVERLANVEALEFVEQSLAKEAGARSTARFDARVLYEKKVDVAAERERLQKELARIEKQIENAERQLGNEQFLSKAPAHIVDGLKKQQAETLVLRDKTRAALRELG